MKAKTLQILSWTIAVSAVLGVTGCAGMLPGDRYQGDGVWRRGDSSTYVAGSPVDVMDLQMRSYSVRPTVTSDFDVDLVIEVYTRSRGMELMRFSGKARPQATAFLSGAFHAENAHEASVATCGITLMRTTTKARITIVSAGPRRFEKELVLPDGWDS